MQSQTTATTPGVTPPTPPPVAPNLKSSAKPISSGYHNDENVPSLVGKNELTAQTALDFLSKEFSRFRHERNEWTLQENLLKDVIIKQKREIENLKKLVLDFETKSESKTGIGGDSSSTSNNGESTRSHDERSSKKVDSSDNSSNSEDNIYNTTHRTEDSEPFTQPIDSIDLNNFDSNSIKTQKKNRLSTASPPGGRDVLTAAFSASPQVLSKSKSSSGSILHSNTLTKNFNNISIKSQNRKAIVRRYLLQLGLDPNDQHVCFLHFEISKKKIYNFFLYLLNFKCKTYFFTLHNLEGTMLKAALKSGALSHSAVELDESLQTNNTVCGPEAFHSPNPNSILESSESPTTTTTTTTTQYNNTITSNPYHLKCVKQFIGHLDSIRSISLFNNNSHILENFEKNSWQNEQSINFVSGSDDGIVKLWQLNNNHLNTNIQIEPSVCLRGHDGPVFATEILQQRNMIISGSYDGLILAWDLADVGLGSEGNPVMGIGRRQLESSLYMESHTDTIWGLSSIPNTDIVLSISADTSVCIWQLPQLDRFPGNSQYSHHGVDISCHSQILPPDEVVSILSDHSTFEHTKDIVPTAISSMYQNTTKFSTAYENNNNCCVAFYDLISGDVISCFDVTDNTTENNVYSSCVYDIISDCNNNNCIYTAHENGRVNMIDIRSNCIEKVFSHVKQSPITSISLSPNGKCIASVSQNGYLHIWDVHSGELQQECKNIHQKKYSESVHSVEWSSNGYLITAGADSKLAIYK